ncbi:hypothetical protein BDZ89DRAFT_1061190 [Hymenopellis radicata]|nr:hypothetical protein BDZ89DRAFT_1061190 [Hymenopellis radicata]
MPPSSARTNLQSLLANATKDLPGMVRFATEITTRLPLRLDPNLDLDSFVDSSCEALWALHEFIKKSSNSAVGFHRLPFLSEILAHVVSCLQLYRDRILAAGDVSRYPRDCYRISVLVLFDFVIMLSSEQQLVSRLVRLRSKTGDSTVVVGSLVPDLVFYLPPSVSYTTDSRNVFYELTSVLYTIIQHGPFDNERPWSSEILSRLISKPNHTISFIERTILEALQMLSVAGTGADFDACLAQFSSAYCAIRRLSGTDDCFSTYAFSPASRRLVMQVVWKVAHSKFLTGSPSTSARPQYAVDQLIQFGVEVGKFIYLAVQVVGREMVRVVLRHRVLESYSMLQFVLDGAVAAIFSPKEVAEVGESLLEAMIPYFVYPSVRRDGLRCRSQMEATTGYRRASTSARFSAALDSPRFSAAKDVLTLCDAKTTCPNLIKWTPRRARCSSCKVTFYCSRQCQKQHWNLMHKRECESLRQERIEARDAVKRNSGFLPALDAAFICSLVHDILWDYPIHTPPWRAAVNLTGAEPRTLYGPMDTAELVLYGLAARLTKPGIFVVVLLPAGSLYQNFSAVCMLSAEWFRSSTVVYWSGMTRLDG